MALRPVILLYEDRYGPTNNFGLHKLVCALVDDTFQLRSVVLDRRLLGGRPMKGRDKVLRACRVDLPKLSFDGRVVIAVLDRDRIHEAIGLKRPTTDQAIRQAILGLCNSPAALRVALIAENTESILRAALRSDPALDRVWVQRATVGKEPQYRDMVLGHIARADRAAIRNVLMDDLPCLRDLRDLVVRAVTDE